MPVSPHTPFIQPCKHSPGLSSVRPELESAACAPCLCHACSCSAWLSKAAMLLVYFTRGCFSCTPLLANEFLLNLLMRWWICYRNIPQRSLHHRWSQGCSMIKLADCNVCSHLSSWRQRERGHRQDLCLQVCPCTPGFTSGTTFNRAHVRCHSEGSHCGATARGLGCSQTVVCRPS